MNKRVAVSLIFMLISSCAFFDRAPDNFQKDIADIQINWKEISLEIADEPDEQRRGLMYRKKLPWNSGMLFVFENEKILTFWMKNTYIDLDIAFLDGEGEITGIKTMRKFSEKIVSSDTEALYAIEMNAGWFRKNRVKVGDRIEIKNIRKAIV